MELSAAIQLIQTDRLTPPNPTTWADLGCGSGLFTFALASLLPAGSTIYAVDKSPVRLDPELSAATVEIKPLKLDFVREAFPWNGLDGMLMANSLHYVPDKKALLEKLFSSLQPSGHLLIVEYDTDIPVPQWVPYPLSFHSLERLLSNFGNATVQHLGDHSSIYGRADLYAALVTL